MLEISTRKVARIILLTREYGPESPHLIDYISGLNEDEQASLVALMWIGRDSFDASELAYAIEEAKREATAPTENYLSGNPNLSDHLEGGLEALGIDVTDVEDNL